MSDFRRSLLLSKEDSEPIIAHYIEDGYDYGPYIEINGIKWAPVNCGIGYNYAYPYGKLYQFGRVAGEDKYNNTYTDGSGTHNAETCTQTNVSVAGTCTSPDDLKFYTTSSSPFDWYTTSTENQLPSWPLNPTDTGYVANKIANPCPIGWRVPSSAELDSLRGGVSTASIMSDSRGTNGAYFDGTSSPTSSSGIFLPASGNRSYRNGDCYNRGTDGGYLSTDVDGIYAKVFNFKSSESKINSYQRAYGFSIRPVYVGFCDVSLSSTHGQILGAESGIYTKGTVITITALPDTEYYFSSWSDGDTNQTRTITLNSDSLNLSFTGIYASPISGEFSINATQKIKFGRSNLRATCSTSGVESTALYRWNFTENQYDYIGNAVGNTSIANQSVGNGVDLFGWVGNSSTVLTGYSTQYGISNSTTSSHYGNSASDVLKSDWGTTINNRGTWRTPTKDEWVYLLNTRKVTVDGESKSPYGHGKVGDVNGLIILPDDWDGSVCTGFTYGNSSWSNVFTSSSTLTWETMENAGCVFLPACGGRGGSSVYNTNNYGFYWSSTPNSDIRSYTSVFYSSYLLENNTDLRYYSYSVRLISPIGHNLGEICYWNGSSISFIDYTQWSSSLGTPLAVCVIPSSHASIWGDGKARFMSVKGVNADGSESLSNTTIVWDSSKSDAGLTKYTKIPLWDNTFGGTTSIRFVDGFVSSDYFASGTQNAVDSLSKYYSTTYMIPSPYASDRTFYSDYIRTISGNNAMSDLDGKSNTSTIVTTLGSTGGEAAKACSLYGTSGITAGEWYLPTIGELGYVMSRFSIINSALNACDGVALANNNNYWSSTEYTATNACYLYSGSGYIRNNLKHYGCIVRPFCKIS